MNKRVFGFITTAILIMFLFPLSVFAEESSKSYGTLIDKYAPGIIGILLIVWGIVYFFKKYGGAIKSKIAHIVYPSTKDAFSLENNTTAELNTPVNAETKTTTQASKTKSSSIIRICALILMFMFFAPTVLVSCEGEDDQLEISAFDVSYGNIGNGEYDDIDAQPLLYLAFVAAVVIYVYADKKPNISLCSAIANAGLMILMYIEISKYVESEYRGLCDTETTYWFALNMISAGIVIFLTLPAKIKNAFRSSDSS